MEYSPTSYNNDTIININLSISMVIGMLNISKIKKYISKSNYGRLKIEDIQKQPYIPRKPLIQEMSVFEVLKHGHDSPEKLRDIVMRRGY